MKLDLKFTKSVAVKDIVRQLAHPAKQFNDVLMFSIRTVPQLGTTMQEDNLGCKNQRYIS